jgi:predicted permease
LDFLITASLIKKNCDDSNEGTWGDYTVVWVNKYFLLPSLLFLLLLLYDVYDVYDVYGVFYLSPTAVLDLGRISRVVLASPQ